MAKIGMTASGSAVLALILAVIAVSLLLIAILWSGLFDAYEPLDVRAMMKAHMELLFKRRRE